ncbi:MAG: acyl carrier protein [Proteobacteria bacterium]|nr:acyl carrier protein [Pseudomonadota bacterium]MCP4916430.1 acyl carrier protein [Pseudomonadota bacterium]
MHDPIRNFLLNELDAGLTDDELENDTPLFGHHGVIDSLAILDVVTFLETTWGFQVQAHEVVDDHFGSIDRLAAFVASRTG